MRPRDELAALIPHQGAMCLNERVLAWDADRVRLATATHRAADNPLRRDGRLRALHLCEYGAQAMAVHGGLCARAAGGRAAPGYLVSLRAVELHCDHVEELPGELEVEAERLAASPESWQYAFEVRHDGRVLARGRAAVMARTA
ncbi:MAG TPA: phosphotransferase [Xanthomonadales bacterium]|nr:phosphotransferase [Xanthomonadales bacterium]